MDCPAGYITGCPRDCQQLQRKGFSATASKRHPFGPIGIGWTPVGQDTSWTRHQLDKTPVGQDTSWTPVGQDTSWTRHQLDKTPVGQDTSWTRHGRPWPAWAGWLADSTWALRPRDTGRRTAQVMVDRLTCSVKSRGLCGKNHYNPFDLYKSMVGILGVTEHN